MRNLRGYKYGLIDEEIVYFLKTEGEKTTRQITDRLAIEVGGEDETFPRSTTWCHLVVLHNNHKIKERLERKGESTGKAYWSINEERK